MSDWPEVIIYANGQVQGRPDFSPVAASSPPEERYVPLSKVRERLMAEAEKLEQLNLEGDGPADLTAATVRAVKAQGIRDALAASFPDRQEPEEEGK